MLNKNKKGHDLPKAQNYFHSAYKLIPTDKDSMRTDVVTFGMAAKLYTDNDSRVLRTWMEEDKTWVAWTNRYEFFYFFYFVMLYFVA